MKIEVDNALQQALLVQALEDKREWEQRHNQSQAVQAIDSLLEQVEPNHDS